MMPSPIVLLGRGGSGTRLLAQIFHDSGVFLGNKLNKFYDSMEWVQPIYGGLTRKLDRSNQPEKLVLPGFSDQLRATAGRICYRGQEAHQGLDIWGWKLPETMMLVPEVVEAFPRVKIIQIVRHPVTSSLRRTHKTSREQDEIGGPVLAAARARVAVPENHQLDADTLNNALSWHLQVNAVTSFCRQTLPASQYLELRYEDLFGDWQQTKTTLCTFSGIPSAQLKCPPLDAARRRSFDLPDPRITDVWQITRDVAKLHGYGIAGNGDPITHSIS